MQPLRRIADTIRIAYDMSKANNRISQNQPFLQFNRATQNVPQWQLLNYQSYAQEGFAENAVIYAAIMYKAKAIAQSPVRAYSGELDQRELLDRTHPLSLLARRPNPFQSGTQLMQLNTVYLNLAGNVYMVIDRDRPGSEIRGIYSLRPDRVRLVPNDDKTLMNYAYMPDGYTFETAIIIPNDNMMHIKFPNPHDEFEGMGYGLSPVSPAARPADVDNLMTTFLNVLFKSGMMPLSAISFDTKVDPDEANEVRDRLIKEYGGSNQWGVPIVMGSGAKFMPMTPTLKDMGFETVDSRDVARILAPFGVSGMLLGLQMENSTFSNFDQAEESFWRMTMLTEQGMYDAELNERIGDPLDDEFLAFDNSGITALQADVNMQADSYTKMVTHGIPPNEAASQVGLKIPHMEFGDISYFPIGLVPMGQVSEGIKEELVDAAAMDLSEGDNAADIDLEAGTEKSLDPISEYDYKQALWLKVDTVAVDWEARFKAQATELFERDLKKILSLLDNFKAKSLRNKATPDWVGYTEAVDSYLSDVALEVWGTEMTPLFLGVIEEQSRFWVAEMGIDYQLRNVEGEAWFAEYKIRFAGQVTDTTSEAIHSVVADTLATGESVEQTANRINLVFQQYIDGNLAPADFDWMTDRMPAYRTEMIARTETHGASSTGSHHLFVDADVKKKEWLATADRKTRDSHLEAWFQYTGSGAIAIGDLFNVGGIKLLHPGDTNSPSSDAARETINCRCIELPVI